MADLEVWKDYVTVINAARLNAIRDHIMTNEGNISYQQTLINANTTNIYTNTNDIANLSATRLPRDGSLPMTGPLVCNSGVKTNSLTTISGNIIDCQKELQVWLAVAGDGSDMFALYSNFWIDAPYIKLYPFGTSAKGKIMIGTPKSDGTVLLRVEIPGGEDVADIKLKDAHLKPYDDNFLYLGSSDKQWKEIYAYKGNFSSLKVNSRIWADDILILENGTSSIEHAQIKLEGHDISLSTPDWAGELTERLYIYGASDDGLILVKNADIWPDSNGSRDLGSNSNKWRTIYAKRGIFDSANIPRAMPFYLENPSSSDKYLLGAGTVSTMYQFNTTITLTGYKLMMLTSASNGYIKVTIDDAKGWNYEKTYSLGSAGGYRYNESFTHIIETDNGIQLKISNCSQISSTSIVLEYK